MKRKEFIRNGLITAGIALATPSALAGPFPGDIFSPEEIREFVFAAHNDFETTKKIVEEKPLILNCTNQGKRGDFETAIGGASHMGRKDIADLLVEKGARLDIFNLAFLGYVDFVKTMIEMSPQYLMAPGPHGFTLLHHAIAGEQEELAAWLKERGLEETHFKGVFGP